MEPLLHARRIRRSQNSGRFSAAEFVRNNSEAIQFALAMLVVMAIMAMRVGSVVRGLS
jgi:hypothetical protein